MFFRFKFHPNFNLKFRFVDKCFGFFGAADADADGSRQGDETFRFSRVIRRKCPKNPKNFGDPTSDPGQEIFFSDRIGPEKPEHLKREWRYFKIFEQR